MPFGTFTSNIQHYFYESHLWVTWATNIPQNTSWNADVGSIVMPWTGDVEVDGWVNFQFTPTIIGAEVWSASAIAPTSTYNGTCLEYNDNGGWVVCPYFAKWSSLAIGTNLTVTLQLKCTAANGTATARSFVGSLRAKAN